MDIYNKILELILLFGGVLAVIILINKYQTKIHKVKVIHAKTKKDIQVGLMFIKKRLPENGGMLFHTGYSTPSFWMKNTYIPLDVIFLNKDMKVIGFSSNNTPFSKKNIRINKPSSYVLEMNGGWGIKNDLKIGDRIEIIQ